VVGRLSAIAAIGSVAGALITGMLLIPNIGSKESLIGIGIGLIILALMVSPPAKRMRFFIVFMAFTAALAAFNLFFPSSAQGAMPGTLVADIGTRYNRIWIFDTPHAEGNKYLRLLRTDPNDIQCGALMEGNAPTDASDIPIFDYTKSFDAAFHALPAPARILILGGCNYSYPRHAARLAPAANIDVVELDEGMTKAAKDWFGFVPPPSINIFHADGRTFLNGMAEKQNSKKYDIVFIDAYNSVLSIPYQLMTEEAFGMLHNSLAPGGIVVFNIIGTFEGKGSSYLGSVLATLKTSFTDIEVFKITGRPADVPQNIIVMASADEAGKETLKDAIGDDGLFVLPEYLLTLQRVPNENITSKDAFVLTDNHAPVEALTKPLREYNHY
jgi:predicted membrane-bound spermidine synthase